MKSEIIHNKDIDRPKWDTFTIDSSTGHIFNLSWYLDIVFPEWQALIISDDHDWIAVLPLYPRKKYGFTISLQPLLIRYSGVIRKEPDFKVIPVIIFTSSKDEGDKLESYLLGANAYVVKPVDIQQFMFALKHLGQFWAVINEPPV